jgi:hypothetical protein
MGSQVEAFAKGLFWPDSLSATKMKSSECLSMPPGSFPSPSRLPVKTPPFGRPQLGYPFQQANVRTSMSAGRKGKKIDRPQSFIWFHTALKESEIKEAAQKLKKIAYQLLGRVKAKN